MASINYARVFNQIHDVNAMLLFNQESKTVELDSPSWVYSPQVPTKFRGTTLKLSYKFDKKLLESQENNRLKPFEAAHIVWLSG